MSMLVLIWQSCWRRTRGPGYKLELARLEALERIEEEKEIQELEMKKVEEGVEQLEIDEEVNEDEMRPGFGTVLARGD